MRSKTKKWERKYEPFIGLEEVISGSDFFRSALVHVEWLGAREESNSERPLNLLSWILKVLNHIFNDLINVVLFEVSRIEKGDGGRCDYPYKMSNWRHGSPCVSELRTEDPASKYRYHNWVVAFAKEDWRWHYQNENI